MTFLAELSSDEKLYAYLGIGAFVALMLCLALLLRDKDGW